MLTKLPLVGKFSRELNISYITRTWGILLKCGVPLYDSVKIIHDTVSNYAFREEISILMDKITHGKSIHSILSQSKKKLFPSLVVNMIRVGEESGKLDEILLYINDYYEKEIDNYSKNLSSIIEPILLLLIGGFIAFIAVSVILPIYQFTSNLKIK